MITWSSIRILSVLAAVAADWVNLSSSVLGLVFPLGWLCESINEVALQRIASLSSTLYINQACIQSTGRNAYSLDNSCRRVH